MLRKSFLSFFFYSSKFECKNTFDNFGIEFLDKFVFINVRSDRLMIRKCGKEHHGLFELLRVLLMKWL